MNPHLTALQPYPFEKLRALFNGITPPAELAPIRLSIGEPQHATPAFIHEAICANLNGLSAYPSTLGLAPLREAIAHWLEARYQLPKIDPATQVLPVNGSREALFAFAQCLINPQQTEQPLVVCPNPFYQIYEGAAYLAGAQPVFLNQTQANGFSLELDSLTPEQWARVQLLYVCSPGNPTGRVFNREEWKTLFELSDRYNFVIASDECYSEIYFDEATPPLGALQIAHELGRTNFERLVVFSSLSKRSNVPGLRSGFVAGDAQILKQYLLYRTYHGCAMSELVQRVSVSAWQDETHVIENRRLYKQKFDAITPLLAQALPVQHPDAAFYLWTPTPQGLDGEAFARALYAHTHVTVLPGQYLAREAHGLNPGKDYVRIALVAGFEECLEAAHRVVAFVKKGDFSNQNT